jgi:hypothetical protein
MNTLTYLVLFTSASFLYYGFACLISPRLKMEFERFGLRNYRKLTGILQLLGASGIVIGLIFPLLGLLASAGLTLLMVAGFATRLKIRDSFLQTFPSFFFMLLNGYITLSYYILI